MASRLTKRFCGTILSGCSGRLGLPPVFGPASNLLAVYPACFPFVDGFVARLPASSPRHSFQKQPAGSNRRQHWFNPRARAGFRQFGLWQPPAHHSRNEEQTMRRIFSALLCLLLVCCVPAPLPVRTPAPTAAPTSTATPTPSPPLTPTPTPTPISLSIEGGWPRTQRVRSEPAGWKDSGVRQRGFCGGVLQLPGRGCAPLHCYGMDVGRRQPPDHPGLSNHTDHHRLHNAEGHGPAMVISQLLRRVR
jgi:hypothetical protein